MILVGHKVLDVDKLINYLIGCSLMTGPSRVSLERTLRVANVDIYIYLHMSGKWVAEPSLL